MVLLLPNFSVMNGNPMLPTAAPAKKSDMTLVACARVNAPLGKVESCFCKSTKLMAAHPAVAPNDATNKCAKQELSLFSKK